MNSLPAFELWRLLLFWLVCVSWRLFQLHVDFGYLLKMNWSSSVAGFKRVKLLGSWFQLSGWMYRAWQVSQFGCFLAAEQRTVGILLLITGDASCQHVSIKCSPVVTFCSFHFGVRWFTRVLTAGTCVISVSTLSNDSWPVLCSHHFPSIQPALNSRIFDWLKYCSGFSCYSALKLWIPYCQIAPENNSIKLAADCRAS